MLEIIHGRIAGLTSDSEVLNAKTNTELNKNFKSNFWSNIGN